RAVEAAVPITLNAQIERTQCAPWGLESGRDALPNSIRVERAEGTVVQPPNGKLNTLQLNPGDTYVVDSGGGGGFGDPFERPVELECRDVRLGYVSVEAARREYGVVIGEDGEVDREATAQLRARGH